MSPESAETARDIILIGGSSGAIEAILKIVKSLPSDLPASLFVVVHTTPQRPGMLARVLDRAGSMSAVFPIDGEPLRRGCVYVAPPDHHLMLAADDTISIYRGPRENGHRPAIDPLFRSAAARGYGPRSIAVLLSGYLDDGSAGLYAVRNCGGIAIVQDPADALVEDMPASALQYGDADYVLPAGDIGPKLLELVDKAGKVITMKKRRGPVRGHLQKEPGIEMPNLLTAYPEESAGSPSVFACPECHGVLWEMKEGGPASYRCRVGHAFSEATLNQELTQATESALWAAMRALEEKAAMSRRLADSAAGTHQWAHRIREQAATYAGHADLLRKMILGGPSATDEVLPPEATAQSGQAD